MGHNQDSIQRLVPLLQVGSIEDALAYYQRVLGFHIDFVLPPGGPPRWAMASRGGIGFMFTTDLGTDAGPFIAEKGNGVVFYAIVEDIDPLYDELCERGVTVVQEPQDYGGRRQFSIADLDGYIIAFSESFIEYPRQDSNLRPTA